MTFKQARQLFFDYWYIPAGLVLIAAVLFGLDRCGTWQANRGIQKDKEKIANTVSQIANIKTEIANLQNQEAEKRGELARDVETLTNQVFGREEAKAEANKALANYNAALAANSNVNATAQDFTNILEKLDK